MINQRALARYLKKKGSPFWRKTPALIQAASSQGVDPRFLAAVAGAETQFGTVGNATAMHNAWGWGPHIRFPSWSAAFNRIARGLKTGYGDEGLDTIGEIAGKWAPRGAGNDPTDLNANWPRNVSQYYRELGGNPNQPVIGSRWQDVSVGGGGGGGGPSGSADVNVPGRPGYNLRLTQPGGERGGVIDWNLVNQIHGQNVEDIQAGRLPDQNRFGSLLSLVQQAIPTLGPANSSLLTVPGQSGYTIPGYEGGAGAPLPDVGPRETFGFARGGVDSGNVTFGGEGGNWGGSLPRALQLAKLVGATPTSQKRTRKHTASGGISDHWSGSTSSYAVDLPYTAQSGWTPRTDPGDRAFMQLVRFLGQPNLRPGAWRNINRDGYRYQLGWQVPGHFNHIHIGVQRVTPSTR